MGVNNMPHNAPYATLIGPKSSYINNLDFSTISIMSIYGEVSAW